MIHFFNRGHSGQSLSLAVLLVTARVITGGAGEGHFVAGVDLRTLHIQCVLFCLPSQSVTRFSKKIIIVEAGEIVQESRYLFFMQPILLDLWNHILQIITGCSPEGPKHGQGGLDNASLYLILTHPRLFGMGLVAILTS